MVGFAFKEALKSFKRAKLHSLFSLLSTCIGLYLILFSFMVIEYSEVLERKIKDGFVLSLFLEDSLSQNEISSLKSLLKEKSYCKSIVFISKDEAAEKFIKETGEDFRTVLDYNPLPATINLSLSEEYFSKEKLELISKELREIKGVESVGFQTSVFEKILNLIESSRKYIFGIAGLLFFIAIYLVYSTLKLIIHSKAEEIETMKLVGAKISFIKLPITIFGVFIGFLSGAISSLLILGTNYFLDRYFFFHINFISPSIYIVGSMLLGIMLGVVTSLFAMRNISFRVR